MDDREKNKAPSRENRKSFDDVTEAIVEAVDSEYFNAAVDPHCGITALFGPGVDVLVHEAFQTTDTETARAVFYKVHRKIDKLVPEVGEIEDIVHAMINAEQFVPLAVGFAAGLRAAGVSKREALKMLSGYLRHFREGTKDAEAQDTKTER
jgi:hypothetical protein